MSPRSKAQNEEIREQRIHEIVLATVEVYTEKGYLGTQMDDVAQAAGLAKGLLYYYFKSKQSLFQYVFQVMMDNAISAPTQILDGNTSIQDTLQKFIMFFITSVYEQPKWTMAYWRMNEDLSKVFPNRGDELNQDFINRFHTPLTEVFRRGMEQGQIRKGDPALFASTFWLGLTGVMLYIIRSKQPADTKQVVLEQVTQQLLFGVLR